MGFFFNLIESIRFMELKRILKVKEHLSEMLTLIENTGGSQSKNSYSIGLEVQYQSKSRKKALAPITKIFISLNSVVNSNPCKKKKTALFEVKTYIRN